MGNALRKGEGYFMENEGKKICTVADIEALPEKERAELIDGEMFTMDCPSMTHQDILGGLYMQIRLHIKEKKGQCQAFLAPFAVYIMNDVHNYVEPDISVICDRDKLDEKGCHGAPDCAVEIVSPSSKNMDYVRKLALYHAAGVREYWIVDPMQKCVVVYDLEHGEGAALHHFSEKVESGILAGLALDFSDWK